MIMTAEDGSPSGAEADLARDIGRKLGVEVRFLRTADTYGGVIGQVARKEADLGVSFLSSNVERALQVYFSRPYITQNGWVFYNRAAFARLRRDYEIETLTELNATAAVSHLEIGVLRGSVYEAAMKREFPRYRLRRFSDLDRLMQSVRDGEIFAGVHGGIQINFYMHRHPSTAIHVAVDPAVHRPTDICIAVRPDAPNLLRWVDIYLAHHVGLKKGPEVVERYLERHPVVER